MSTRRSKRISAGKDAKETTPNTKMISAPTEESASYNGVTASNGRTTPSSKKSAAVDKKGGSSSAKRKAVHTDEELKNQLVELLTKAQNSKIFEFAIGGISNIPPLPGINISNYGVVNLPVTESTIKDLKQHFVQAPYGLGEETLIDKDVRDSWQLNPDKFNIENPNFKDGVQKLVKDVVQKQLDCSKQKVTCQLYKLLLYEPGGHFKPHRDTEKFPGMFATLIIQLPSVFSGGDFIVKHGDSEKTIAFGTSESQFSCIYAAHYADCEHELTEITSGYRLALVYSLCWDGNGEAPEPPTDISTSKLADLLGQIDEVLPDPHMIAWGLDHQYSENSFLGNGVKTLKSADYHIYSIFEAANSLLEDDKKLEFLIIEAKKLDTLWGECMFDQGYCPRRGYDCFEFVEHGETDYEVTAITVDGKQLENFEEDFDVEDMTDAVLNLNRKLKNVDKKFWGKCHKGECTGPSGNEGATKTNWYQRYVLLVFLKDTF